MVMSTLGSKLSTVAQDQPALIKTHPVLNAQCLFLNGADVIEAKVQPLKVDQSCKIFDNDL